VTSCPFPYVLSSWPQPSINYIQASVQAVLHIVASEGPGDILVFLPGMEVRTQLDIS
jgi:HrpA-like RNA helicase